MVKDLCGKVKNSFLDFSLDMRGKMGKCIQCFEADNDQCTINIVNVGCTQESKTRLSHIYNSLTYYKHTFFPTRAFSPRIHFQTFHNRYINFELTRT